VEFFYKILPFIVPILIMLSMYYQYKNKDKEEKPSWLEQQPLIRYIKLVFFTRVYYRQWTIFFALPLWFSLIIGMVNLIGDIERLVYPPLPLEKMQIQHGAIKSITDSRKMDDLLILQTDNGATEKYAYDIYGSMDRYIDRNVTIFYTRGFSSGFTIDNKIYEIIADDTNATLNKYPYSYEHSVEFNKSTFNFTMYCFLVAIISGYMVWLFNHKELPIHRLGRIKMRKKTNKKL